MLQPLAQFGLSADSSHEDEEEIAQITRLIQTQMASFARSLNGVQQQVTELAAALGGRTEELRELVRLELQNQLGELSGTSMSLARTDSSGSSRAASQRLEALEQATARHADALAAAERRLDKCWADIDRRLQASAVASRDAPLRIAESPAPCFGLPPAGRAAGLDVPAVQAHYASIRESLEFIRRSINDTPARVTHELDAVRGALEAHSQCSRGPSVSSDANLQVVERLCSLQGSLSEHFGHLSKYSAVPARLQQVEFALSTADAEQSVMKEHVGLLEQAIESLADRMACELEVVKTALSA